MKISLATTSSLILFQFTLPIATTAVNTTVIEEEDDQGNSGGVDEDNTTTKDQDLGEHPLFPYLEPEEGSSSEEEDGEGTDITDGDIEEVFTDLGELFGSLFGDLEGEMEDTGSNPEMEGNDKSTDPFSDFEDFFDGLGLDTSSFEDGDGDPDKDEGDDFFDSFLDGFSDDTSSGGLGDDFLGSMLGGGFMGEAMGALEIVPPELLQCVGFDEMGFDLDSGIDGMDEKCLEKETATFKQQISDFDQCTGWNMIELIEHFPSILVGSGMNCLNVLMDDSAEPSDEDVKQCKESFLGENPFGSVIHDIILNSDQVCSCYSHLYESPLPECTLDQWPIPISGKAVNSFACIVSFGCKYADSLCELESWTLDSCLPDDNEDFTCDDTTEKCISYESMLFPHPMLTIPLPGACRRVFSSTGNNELVDRYDKFSGKCLKDTMNVWNKHVDFKSGPSQFKEVKIIDEVEEKDCDKSKDVIVKSMELQGSFDSSPSSGKNVIFTQSTNEAESSSGGRLFIFTALAFVSGMAASLIVYKFINKGKNAKGRYDAIESQLPSAETA